MSAGDPDRADRPDRAQGSDDPDVEGSLLAAQAKRLAPFRERLLRRVTPGLRGATLDLACGHGSIAAELAARVAGPVIAADAHLPSLSRVPASVPRVLADAHELPFRDASFDLVVTQLAWLWWSDPSRAAAEVLRILAPGGALVAIGEPDFGGAIEEPSSLALAPIWEAALSRAGANPRIGRALPGALRRAGFARVEAEIFGIVAAPDQVAAIKADEAPLLRVLPLTPEEAAALDGAVAAAREAPPDAVSFVPAWGVVAFK